MRFLRTPISTGKIAVGAALWLDRDVDGVRREEIRHRLATSLELPTLLLRQMYGDDPPPVIPILCGRGALEDDDGQTERMLGALERITSRYRTLVWASAELTHAGPAFGAPVLDADHVEARDRAIINPLVAGRLTAFENALTRHSFSGAATLMTWARLLPVGASTSLADYAVVHTTTPDADNSTPGLVGCAGLRAY